jgi:hypothetical protein
MSAADDFKGLWGRKIPEVANMTIKIDFISLNPLNK